MIKAKCIGFKGPSCFAAVPLVGDLVRGEKDGKECELKIIKVVHTVTTSHDRAMNRTYDAPLIEVYV